MDPQLIQALQMLMESNQQQAQILQQIAASLQGGAMAPEGDDPNAMPAEGDPYGDAVDPNAPAEGEYDPAGQMGTSDMPGGGAPMPDGNLHERVAQLESHTGLKKSASTLPLVQRLAALEDHWLGETFEGPVRDRLSQIEGFAGLKKSASVTSEEAPDVIPLDALIKAAARQGASEAIAALRQASDAPEEDDGLPDLNRLRKSSRQAVSVGQRRSQAQAQQGEQALVKAAEQWGIEEDDLDKPAGFADILQAQYFAQQAGGSLFSDDADD